MRTCTPAPPGSLRQTPLSQHASRASPLGCDLPGLTFSHQSHAEAVPEQSQVRHLKSRRSQSGGMGKQHMSGVQITTPQRKPM